MSSLPSTPLEGEALRDAALALLRTRRAALVRACERAAVWIALDRGTLTADDVRDLVPIPKGFDSRLVGAAFRALADAGILRLTGFRKSRRPAAHARPLACWQLADADSAWAWLAEHPPIESE